MIEHSAHDGPPDGSFGGRVVVVSPHLDDAVLSLGASIGRAAGNGAYIEVLTVFGCDPMSDAPASRWDRRAGFSTEGDAASARREEDRRACSIVGATPVSLGFGSTDYERHGGETAIHDAVSSVVAGADMALVPGFPLTHPDHAWLTELLVREGIPVRRLGLYVEHPYALRVREVQPHPVLPAWVEAPLGFWGSFARLPTGIGDWWMKSRAIREYRSQLPLLGLPRKTGTNLLQRLWLEMRAQGEAVAWTTPRPSGL